MKVDKLVKYTALGGVVSLTCIPAASATPVEVGFESTGLMTANATLDLYATVEGSLRMWISERDDGEFITNVDYTGTNTMVTNNSGDIFFGTVNPGAGDFVSSGSEVGLVYHNYPAGGILLLAPLQIQVYATGYGGIKLDVYGAYYYASVPSGADADWAGSASTDPEWYAAAKCSANTGGLGAAAWGTASGNQFNTGAGTFNSFVCWEEGGDEFAGTTQTHYSDLVMWFDEEAPRGDYQATFVFHLATTS